MLAAGLSIFWSNMFAIYSLKLIRSFCSRRISDCDLPSVPSLSFLTGFTCLVNCELLSCLDRPRFSVISGGARCLPARAILGFADFEPAPWAAEERLGPELGTHTCYVRFGLEGLAAG